MTTVLYNAITASDAVRGVERYHLGLIPALAAIDNRPRLIVLTAPWQNYYAPFDEVPGVQRVILKLPRGRISRGLWQLIDGGTRGRRFDLLHLGNVLPVPFGVQVPIVSMVYDLIESHNIPSYTRFRRLARRMLVKRVVSRSSAIVTMSATSAYDLRQLRAVNAARVVDIGTGITQREQLPLLPSLERDRSLVFIGSLDAHKRLDLVIRALAADRRLHLRVVSGGGPAEDGLRRLAAELKVGWQIEWLGRLDDDAARVVLARSAALVMASDREGFGLPILEALRDGTPVILAATLPFASKWASVGGPVFRGGDQADLSRVLARFLDDTSARHRLGQLGTRLVKEFAWSLVAQRLSRVYDSVLAPESFLARR